MSTHDLNGRPYAKLSELRVGDKVMVDGGFSCMHDGDVKIVKEKDGLYIDCRYGHHHLHALATDDEHCIGIYRLS